MMFAKSFWTVTLFGILIAATPTLAEIRVLNSQWNVGSCGASVYPTVSVTVQIDDWRELKVKSEFERFLLAMRADGISRCPRTKGVYITIVQAGVQYYVVDAKWYGTTQKWDVKSRIAELDQQEIRRQEDQAKAVAGRKRREELLVKMKAAVVDCGSSPNISGGPWFSSTYKVAVLDNVRRLALTPSQIQDYMNRLTQSLDSNVFRRLDNMANQLGRDMDTFGKYFLCVKEVKYIGPAVNPQGGNAARALFSGYGIQAEDYRPVSYTHDFPY